MIILRCKKNIDVLIVGKDYVVDDYENDFGSIDYDVNVGATGFLYFCDDFFIRDYIWDYFYTVEETRKMKIESIIKHA